MLTVSVIEPEAIWAREGQAAGAWKSDWRAAPVCVEIYWDESSLGVKGLSNIVIAGFLRNLCK